MTRSTHHPGYQLFLERLRTARKETDATQETLAERLGNHQVFVSKLERGQRRMDIIDLFEYCQAAEIDFMAFVTQLHDALQAMPTDRGRGKLSVRSPARKRGGRPRKK